MHNVVTVQVVNPHVTTNQLAHACLISGFRSDVAGLSRSVRW
jgi:hypothetical protein